MLLRGITFKGECHTFTIYDCPVIINSNTVALVNRENSPLIKYSTIARGDDSTGIFEGDFVFDKDLRLVGHVYYSNGFRILSKNKNTIEFKDMQDYIVVENSKESIFFELAKYRNSIEFKYHDTVFDFSHLVTINNGLLHLNKKLLRPIELSDVKISTGYSLNGEKIFYKDCVADGIIELNNLRPMVKLYYKEEYRDLKEGEYDD